VVAFQGNYLPSLAVTSLYTGVEPFHRENVLAHNGNYELAFSSASFMLRAKRMNATIYLKIRVQITGHELRITDRGEL
jgi:hypothetical protein